MIYTNCIPLQRAEKCGILTEMKPVLQHRPANKSGMQRRKSRRAGEWIFLELEQAKQRVEELRTIIEKNNRLYYDQDAPELEDFEYDALDRKSVV